MSLSPSWRETPVRIRQNAALALTQELDAARTSASPSEIATAQQDASRFFVAHAGTPEAAAIALASARFHSPFDDLRRPIDLASRVSPIPANLPDELVHLTERTDWRCWNRVVSLTPSTDGNLLACVSTDRTTQVFDLRRHERIAQWLLPGLPREGAFLSGEATLAVALEDDRIALYSALDGSPVGMAEQCRPPFAALPAGVEWAAVVVDTTGRDSVGIWSRNAALPQRRFEVGPALSVVSVVPHPAQPWLTVETSPGGVAVWNVESREPLRAWPQARAPRFNAAGTLLAMATRDGDVAVYEMDATGPKADARQRLESAGSPLAFHPGRAELLSWNPSRVIVWDLDRGVERRTLLGVPPLIAFDFAGDRLIGSDPTFGEWTAWNIVTGTKTTVATPEPLTALALPTGRNLLVGTTPRHSLRLWELSSGKPLEPNLAETWPQELSVTGDRFVCRRDGKLTVLNATGGEPLMQTRDSIDAQDELTFSSTRQFIACQGGMGFFHSSLRLWRCDTGEPVDLDAIGAGRVLAVGWSLTDEELVLARDFRSVGIWNSRSRAWQELNVDLPANAIAAAFSPNGTEIALACEDRSQWIYERETQRLVPLKGLASRVTRWCFSSNGRWLAGTASDRVLLFDLSKRRLIRTITELEAGVNSAEFNRQSTQLAVATNGGNVEIWDLPQPLPRELPPPRRIQIGPPGGRVWQVRFTPDGRHLVTLNGDGTIAILRLGTL
ncbi:MAG: WD40 repeat domain-containing protein [Planctomycetota bacterium]|nr:WD40 repeat domain-containing protein [Planctomycetota bacterium]